MSYSTYFLNYFFIFYYFIGLIIIIFYDLYCNKNIIKRKKTELYCGNIVI